MKTRNMILSGLFAFTAIMLVSQVAQAMTIGVPVDENAPQVYLVKKEFDICDMTGFSGGNDQTTGWFDGGSVPPSYISGEGEEQAGCVDWVNSGERYNEYLFTGEQLGILVVVRDLNGADVDLQELPKLLVDGVERAWCNEIGFTEGDTLVWAGHDVTTELNHYLPPEKGAMEAGFDSDVDKLYECIFTVTSGDYGDAEVIVEVTDKSGLTGVGVPENVWLNPEVSLDFLVVPDDSITFPAGTCEQQVYSPDTLKIKNTAAGGVDLVLWLAGTDIEAADGAAAKCPTSNIIDVETSLEFRCKIGTQMDNEWRHVPNPNDKLNCEMDSCQGAEELTEADPTGNHVLGNMHTAECWFRFTYPCPCNGDFEEGGEIIIYARAI